MAEPVRAGGGEQQREGEHGQTGGDRARALPLNRWRQRQSKAAPPSGLRWRELEDFDARADRLWESLRGDFALQCVRDSRYLQWRYRQVPGPRHRIFALLREDNEIAALAVLRPGEGLDRPAQITELLAPAGAPAGTWRALIRGCLAWAWQRGESSLQCWMFSHCAAHPHLLEAGFFSEATPDYRLLVRPTFLEERPAAAPAPPFSAAAWLEQVRRAVYEPSSWYLSIGDADLF